VLLRQERIDKIGTIASLPVPQGYERISTDRMAVLPGLWDPHVHLIYAGHPESSGMDEQIRLRRAETATR